MSSPSNTTPILPPPRNATTTATNTTNTTVIPVPNLVANPAPNVAPNAVPQNAAAVRAAARRSIRGPQSALTDFLASHNINANQIRQTADARRAAAAATAAALNNDEDNGENSSMTPDVEPEPVRKETKAQTAKRKKEEEKAIAKIKASKSFQRKRRAHGSDDSDEDEAARREFELKAAAMPGQMENCEICDKRFTVTTYSRAGDAGGLLCPQCSKELDKEEGAAKKKRKVAAGRQRRQVQSNLLDGIYPGAKDLMTLCIETLAKNVEMAEDLGDLPATMVDRLAAILSKKRLIKPNTLNLFLRPGYDTVTVYDGAYLSSDDYIRIFQYVPTIKRLRLRNAVQFKNKVMDHLLGTAVELESLSLHGSNLIDDERWNKYLTEKGSHLKALKVYHTDGHFGDEQIEHLTKTTPQLQRLKISHNQKVTDNGLKHIASLPALEHLSLEIYKDTNSEPYVEILESIGAALRTFCLSTVHYIDDSVLKAIHDNCKNLRKLRITDNEVLTDEGFANLFTSWLNPPLHYVDFHKCRYVDATKSRENPDGIGFGSLGFAALMAHSGKSLRYLRIDSCRHISVETFEEVFAEDKKYLELKEIDLSFCQTVNDFVIGSIFRSCPNLKSMAVFGNFGVKDVIVPQGKILIGVPNALGMRIEGTEDGEGRVV